MDTTAKRSLTEEVLENAMTHPIFNSTGGARLISGYLLSANRMDMRIY